MIAMAITGYTLRITIPGRTGYFAGMAERVTRRMLEANMPEPELFIEPWVNYDGEPLLRLIAHAESHRGERASEHVTNRKQYEQILLDIRDIVNQSIGLCTTSNHSSTVGS